MLDIELSVKHCIKWHPHNLSKPLMIGYLQAEFGTSLLLHISSAMSFEYHLGKLFTLRHLEAEFYGKVTHFLSMTRKRSPCIVLRTVLTTCMTSPGLPLTLLSSPLSTVAAGSTCGISTSILRCVQLRVIWDLY